MTASLSDRLSTLIRMRTAREASKDELALLEAVRAAVPLLFTGRLVHRREPAKGQEAEQCQSNTGRKEVNRTGEEAIELFVEAHLLTQAAEQRKYAAHERHTGHQSHEPEETNLHCALQGRSAPFFIGHMRGSIGNCAPSVVKGGAA